MAGRPRLWLRAGVCDAVAALVPEERVADAINLPLRNVAVEETPRTPVWIGLV